MNTCAKHGKKICVACFLQTLLFPIEHFIWFRIFGVHL